MGRSILAAFFALTVPLLAPQARAEGDPLLRIVETRETELDLNGDGDIDLVRKFDATGRVIESRTRFTDGSVEWYRERRGGRERESRLELPNRRWRITTDHWPTERGWVRRVIQEGPRGGAPDRRTTEEIRGAELVTTRFRSGPKGAWTEVSVERGPATHESLPLPDVSSVTVCPACPEVVEPASACARYRVDPLDLARLPNLESYTPLECRNDRDLVLTNGFRVDLSTCGASAATLEWARNLSQNMLRVIRCAAGWNPDMATHLLNAIGRLRPRIRCLGDLSPDDVREACTEAPDAGTCVTQTAAHGGAFNTVGTPDLVLTRPGARSPVNPTGQVSSMMTHELMHAAGIPHDHSLHDAVPSRAEYRASLPPPANTDEATATRLENWSTTDPVYAVQSLCGGDPAGTEPPIASVDTLPDLPNPMDKWIAERGPIPRPSGPPYTPPGNAFEMACTALASYRPGATTAFSTFDQTSVSPACRSRSTEIAAAIAARDERRRLRAIADEPVDLENPGSGLDDL